MTMKICLQQLHNLFGLATDLALVVLLFAELHRADESQPARNSCSKLYFDSRFGHYHVAVVLSFLRSQISLAVISVTYVYFWLIKSFTDPAYTCSIFCLRSFAFYFFLIFSALSFIGGFAPVELDA